MGGCPGELDLYASGTSLAGEAVFVSARNEGATTIPPGFTCEGTALQLDSMVRMLGTADADQNATATLSLVIEEQACAGVYQAIDLTGCETSQIERH